MISQASVTLTVAAARDDHRERTLLHARQCVCFAVVTSENLAAELIDRAVELSASAAEPHRALEVVG